MQMTLIHCPASLLTLSGKAHTGLGLEVTTDRPPAYVFESILNSSIKDMFFWRYFTEILKRAKSPDC